MIDRVLAFLQNDLWRMRLSQLPPGKAFFIRALRIIALSFTGLSNGRIHLRASSLTFYSLLSVVPVLAMLFGIAKGFGLDKVLEKQIFERIQGQEEALRQILGFAEKLLETTKGGVIAGFGVIVLFWSIIKVFGNIEESFNEVWGVRQGRSLLRKFTDYSALFFFSPVLLITSSTFTVLISSGVTGFVERVEFLQNAGPFISFLLKLLPMATLWILFTLTYAIMPNTRVQLTSAALAGVVAGSAYQMFQQIYIMFQVGVASYNAIYGSFAALPLFLAWLQTSWLIVLVGAEISCAHQNAETREYDRDVEAMSPYAWKLTALVLMHFLVSRFTQGAPPADERQIAETTTAPLRLVQRSLEALMKAGIVAEVKAAGRQEPLYQPAVDASVLSIHFVLESLDHSGQEGLPPLESDVARKIMDHLKQAGDVAHRESGCILLKDL